MYRIRIHIVFALCFGVPGLSRAGLVPQGEPFRCGGLYASLSQMFWPQRGDLSPDAKPKLLSLVGSGSSILRQVAKEVPRLEIRTPAMQQWFDDMIYTMRRQGGIGLAAPQVGQGLRVAVILGPKGPLIMINPRLTVRDSRTEAGTEGCLSLPGISRSVERFKGVRLEFTDRAGNDRILDLADLPARVAQHEFDHLNGTLITTPR